MEWEDYWRKGEENLEIAGLALRSKKYNVCASRAYYEVFLASIAALIKLTAIRAADNEWQHGPGARGAQPAIDYAEEIATI